MKVTSRLRTLSFVKSSLVHVHHVLRRDPLLVLSPGATTTVLALGACNPLRTLLNHLLVETSADYVVSGLGLHVADVPVSLKDLHLTLLTAGWSNGELGGSLWGGHLLVAMLLLLLRED